MRDPLEGVAADGTIRTGAARSRVPAVYEPVLAALVAAFEQARASGPASLLLYGSVATGQARPPRSDVDVVAVGLPAGAAGAIGTALSLRSAELCREVAVGAAQPATYEGDDDDEAHGNRVFLKHYCVLLAGDDLAAAWPPFPADARAARGFNGDIALRLQDWREQAGARTELDSAAAAALGRRVARKTLVTAAGLVSVHDRTWTTDRASAARRWGEVDPATSDDLRRLASWAEDERTATVDDVRRALTEGGVVQRVADAFRERIDLWDAGGRPVLC